MIFKDLLTEEFIIEQINHNSLLLLDIDDTLVKPRNIFIYRKLPSDKKEVKLTPEQYAQEKVTPETKKYYDYREFRNPEKVANSIKTGLPLVGNLKLMDKYIENGWKIGILTARGMEDVIANTMRVWLKYKNAKGNLKNIGDKLVRELVYAINTDNKNYAGKSDFEKKANVLKKLVNKYDRIMFVDDDEKNIQAVKEMVANRWHQNPKLKRIYTKLAHKE